MKLFRIDLLTLLISLFILNSCKNENLVGLAPGTQSITGSLDDTATVYTNTVAEDTIPTNSMTKLPLGYLVDPVLGTTESDMIADINLPGNDASSGNVEYTRPTGTIVVDSALLVLNYADGFYGDSLTKFTINAYQLTERPFSSKEYYDNKRWGYNAGSPIGSLANFTVHPKDSLKIYTIVHGAKDTLIKVPPQVRIPISASFIQANLFNAGTTTLNSNLIFQNITKGFFLNINKTLVNSTTGGTAMFAAPGDSSLQVYVRITNGSVVDTNLIYLNVTQHATQVNHVFSSQVQSALNQTAQNTANNTSIPDNYVYLQAGGLKSKITFPYLKNLFSSIPGGINSVVINRAELVVTKATGVPGDITSSKIPGYLVPAPKLTLYRHDITGLAYTVEDATSGEGAFFGVPEFGGYFNITSNSQSPGYQTYHFLITEYLQNILSGITVDYGTYMAAVDTTNTTSVDIAPTLQTAARTIGVGGNNKSNPYRIKLNVIYTRTKQ